MIKIDDETYLSTKETCAEVGLSAQHTRRLEAAGKFPARAQFGGRVFWRKSDIDNWKRERLQAAPARNWKATSQAA